MKAIEIEHLLREDPSGGGQLTVDAASQLPPPDGSSYDPPIIGDEPAVDAPPRVIAGEIVNGDSEE